MVFEKEVAPGRMHVWMGPKRSDMNQSIARIDN